MSKKRKKKNHHKNPLFISLRIQKNAPESHAKYCEKKDKIGEHEQMEYLANQACGGDAYESNPKSYQVSDEALMGDIGMDLEALDNLGNDDFDDFVHPRQTWDKKNFIEDSE